MNGVLERMFDEQEVSRAERNVITNYLDILRRCHFTTYQHSIRVAIIATRMASECGIKGVSPKALLCAALLHDIGKIKVNQKLLDKKTAFTEADHRAMDLHVIYGWRLLRYTHDYTANIIRRHHRFGPRLDPTKLPPLPAHLKSRRSIIEVSARLLALADYYDAIVMRNDKRFGKRLTQSQKRRKYLKDNADQRDLILRFEEKGILKFSC